MADLKKIDVSVPSVKGDIKVQLRRTQEQISITLDSPPATVARVGVPKIKDGMQVTCDAECSGEDEKYIYFLAKPGHHEFVGR